MRVADVLTAFRTAYRSLLHNGNAQAGNLAYLSLLTVFPFFVLVVIVAGVVWRTEDGMRAVIKLLSVLPPSVAELLNGPVSEVVAERASGGLITFGILVILWTVTNYAEAVRNIIREAHGEAQRAAVWRHRFLSLAIVLASVFLMLVALASQLFLSGTAAILAELVPAGALPVPGAVFSVVLPAFSLFGGLCLAFYGLTMRKSRRWHWIWPGALVIAAGWILVTMAMPLVLAEFRKWSLAYGSLTSVIVTLIYFWILGLWLIFGVHFNAALAKAGQTRLKGRLEA